MQTAHPVARAGDLRCRQCNPEEESPESSGRASFQSACRSDFPHGLDARCHAPCGREAWRRASRCGFSALVGRTRPPDYCGCLPRCRRLGSSVEAERDSLYLRLRARSLLALVLPLLLLLPPPVPGQALRLVHIEHRDHEQRHQADTGVEEVAPSRPARSASFAARAMFARELTVGMCSNKTIVERTVS